MKVILLLLDLKEIVPDEQNCIATGEYCVFERQIDESKLLYDWRENEHTVKKKKVQWPLARNRCRIH